MNIFIIHAHTANRGDEAAIKAMVDELLIMKSDLNIVISLNSDTRYPAMRNDVVQIDRMPIPRNNISKIDFVIMFITNGHFAITRYGKQFLNYIKNADIVLHAPGGPSIGDIYYKDEILYLMRLNIIRHLGVPYMFYAPSMGPFSSGKRRALRKRVLEGASKIVLRDPISVKYLKEFLPDAHVDIAFDSALQHDIDFESNNRKYVKYEALHQFIVNYKKCIGITITDLAWHPEYKRPEIRDVIFRVFNEFIDMRISEGYGIVFIPQLYGESNDYNLMKKFMRSANTFILDDKNEEYDTYFQQYVIGQLYGMVGMRYHSNIFSAKMNTPFISIAYEQKMKGFMERLQLMDYCIEMDDFEVDVMEDKWKSLVGNYDIFKDKLFKQHEFMKRDSRKTSEFVIDLLENKLT